jgi:hypothetical protein
MGSQPVFNYPLPPQYYNTTRPTHTIHHYHPMALQRSSGSTDSSWSVTSAESYQAHGRARPAASTQATSQYPSYGATHNHNYQQETSPSPKTPSEKGDR